MGNSVCNVHNRPNQFRMTKQRLLPDFGNRNPFRDSTERTSTKDVAQPQAARDAQSQVTLDLAEKPAADPLVITPIGVPLSDAAASEDTPSPEPKPYQPARGGWRRWFRWPFGRQKRRLRGKDAVQAELSLESVQPVRNTLVDTDLEIVLKPAKPPSNPFIGAVSRPTSAEEAPAQPRAPRSGVLWSRVTQKWFGSK